MSSNKGPICQIDSKRVKIFAHLESCREKLFMGVMATTAQ